MSQHTTTAVVGGGIAALTLASRLPGCVLFDKARGPGGRTANRRGEDGRRWEHGAPFFDARTPAFAEELRSWVAAGVAEPFDLPHADRPVYRGAPTMTSPAKYLARGLDYRSGCRMVALESDGPDRHTLVDKDGNRHGPFGRVVLTCPAQQTAELAPTLGVTAEMAPRWSGLLVAEVPAEVGYTEVEGDEVIEKLWPTVGDRRCWVVTAHAAFSGPRVDDEPAEVAPRLAEAFERRTGGRVTSATAHRWRFGVTARPQGTPFLAQGGVYACGDWLLGDRVEHAFLSATALAEHLSA